MTHRRLARVFWLGAAAILVAAALISLVAILEGGFSETDGRILGTLGSLLYTGAAALAGLALVDRGPARGLGRAVVGLAGVTFALMALAIWAVWGEDADWPWRLAMSGALYLLAGLATTTGLLLTTRPALQRLVLVGGALTVLAVSLTLVPIWRDTEPGGTLGKAIGASWILAALALLLAPVLQRWSAVGETETGDRVLGTLDEVELVATRRPGDDLVVTDRPRGGERLVLRRKR